MVEWLTLKLMVHDEHNIDTPNNLKLVSILPVCPLLLSRNGLVLPANRLQSLCGVYLCPLLSSESEDSATAVPRELLPFPLRQPKACASFPLSSVSLSRFRSGATAVPRKRSFVSSTPRFCFFGYVSLRLLRAPARVRIAPPLFREKKNAPRFLSSNLKDFLVDFPFCAL